MKWTTILAIACALSAAAGGASAAKLEPSAVHLPKTGEGGWYVKFGSIVGRAPIKDLVWTGTGFAGTAHIPGQDPMAISGTAEGESITMNVPIGNGQVFALQGTLQH